MKNTLAIVLVLYKTRLSENPNYDLLKELVSQPEITLLVYDNSPTPQVDQLFNVENVVYQHNPLNPGLAVAYNTAIDLSQKKQVDLLLLLDQDTEVPESYFRYLLQTDLEDDFAVYVPLIQAKGQQISPVYSDNYVGGSSKIPTPGIYQQAIMAINSGTVLTRKTMAWLGHFSLDFPLDFLDHWFFFQLNQANLKIAVVAITLQQELSVLDYRQVSLTRYESIIRSESLFYKKYDQNKLSAHKRHLVLRAAKQFLLVKNRQIWRRTVSEFFWLMKGK